MIISNGIILPGVFLSRQVAVCAVCAVFLFPSGWVGKWDNNWIKSRFGVFDIFLELPETRKASILPYHGTYEAEIFKSRHVSGCLGNFLLGTRRTNNTTETVKFNQPLTAGFSFLTFLYGISGL